MNYNLELQKLELKLETITAVEDRINILKQAIQLADSNQDVEWGFDFRLRLISEEVCTSHCVESFSAFSWILDAYDKNPDIFDESEFLWEYKWMAKASYCNANISKEQIENIIEDLKSRMLKNGYSLRGYYSIVIAWKQFLGLHEEVDKYIQLREKEQRDDMSHCPACELDTKVGEELRKGNIEEALTMANDLINKKLTCAHMPFATFCNFAYYLNIKKDERASIFFEKAMEELNKMDETDSSILISISLLIHYLIDNDEKRAFSFYEKYSIWELDADDYLKFTFSKNILPLFRKGTKKDLQINVQHPLFSESGEYELSELYNYYYKQAKLLSEKFDTRNQTSHFSELLESAIIK